MIPSPSTVEQLRDFFEWHVQQGMGNNAVMLDKRGLEYLVQPKYVGQPIGLVLPTDGESANNDAKQIFLRATFA